MSVWYGWNGKESNLHILQNYSGINKKLKSYPIRYAVNNTYMYTSLSIGLISTNDQRRLLSARRPVGRL